MMNLKNLIKALGICIVVNAIYSFHVSSSAFQAQAESLGLGENAGRLEAFNRASEVIEGFWLHVLEGWAYTFSLSFVSCILLLIAVQQTHNKALKKGRRKAAPLS
jgi:hypothetical protein